MATRGPQAKPTRTERMELWRRLRRLAERGDAVAIAELLRLSGEDSSNSHVRDAN